MPNLSLLIKPVSGACNLRCRYCFYLDESARRQTACFGTMSETTLQTLVRRAFAYADGPVSFAFQGGEPLLAGKSFYRQVLALQKQYNTRCLPVTNALQTNGTLLDDDWAELFAQGQFLVGISLDGPASLHDRYRVDAAGAATQARALQGAELLKNTECRIISCALSRSRSPPRPIRYLMRWPRTGICNSFPVWMRWMGSRASFLCSQKPMVDFWCVPLTATRAHGTAADLSASVRLTTGWVCCWGIRPKAAVCQGVAATIM